MQNFVQNNNYGLLIDLDGTIIQKNEFITGEVEKSIKKLNQYMPIAIVTGRGPQDVWKFSSYLDLYGPQYCENGASAVKAQSKEILEVSLIPDDLSAKIMQEFKNSNLEYLVVSDGKTLINPQNYLSNISSLVLSSKVQNDLEKFVKKYNTLLDSNLIEFSTDENGNYFINIHNNPLGKAKAYDHFKEFYNLQSENIFFIGDGVNDLSIIDRCANSIAMGNANKKVKSNSKYITESVYEDGVSEAIKKIILPSIKAY
ncbi:MAG: HAD family hydrolase [Dehalococcoidia bacterium]|nr:HAD-IIB family hydrolase [Chloroflexota bacterium]|tara:strand:- start:65 stop:835 length:771 start_codon:yes stop_codon:yes gene_type:complete